MNTREKDKKFFARDTDAFDLEISRADDSFIYDVNNKKYIDFTSGWCVGNLGWNNKNLKEKVNEFNGPDYVYPSYLYSPWAELAELLAQITPKGLSKSFRATGGSEAVEIALSIANAYTKRCKFLSIEGSFHGDTIGAMSVGGSQFRKIYPGLLHSFEKITPPLDDSMLEKIEKLLSKKDVAAFIMEPVICNLGVLIPEKTFMQTLQELCRKSGTLLIIDEVATGFGRTGKLFAVEHFGLEPDIMCMSKAITGGYGPLGATIAKPEIADAIKSGSSYYSTYGWYPRSVHAALLNIRFILNNQEKLEKNVAELSNYFHNRLKKMNFESESDIRIKGLTIGVTIKKKEYAKKLNEETRKKGLLISSFDKGLSMFPSLNITKEIAKEGLDILESCL